MNNYYFHDEYQSLIYLLPFHQELYKKIMINHLENKYIVLF